MKWEQMGWTAKARAVGDVFGTTNSDCDADELLHLWEQIAARGLQDAYITELAMLLGMAEYGYAPAQIVTMMTASNEAYHWPAALRAAGRWEY